MIGLSDIVKSFGRERALDGVSIDFPVGRMTALLGPNGSGKTTALKTLLGLVRPDRGTVLWNGAAPTDERAVREHISYMPQIARFPENLTIREFLAMIADLRPRQPTRTEEMLARFELADLLPKPLKGLSGGTRQRVCAVMTLMYDAPVYIFDEPTAGLDPLMARRFKDAVAREKAAGKTIIFTSHIMGDIEELADHIVFLLEGAVVFDGTLDALYARTGEHAAEDAIAVLIARAGGNTRSGIAPSASDGNQIRFSDTVIDHHAAADAGGTRLREVRA
ncbi:MAG: ABC transporter ATP-binding protein [Bacteroidota bacterium]|jgi:Cu-processing system ATP-binding protein|nr:ABC transporter ATP-binding protein [Bacteroidota bacterium]